MNRCIYNKNCRILRFHPPQIPTCLTWNNQIWPISKEKSCWTFKPKTTELFFSMVFRLLPPSYKLQADMTLLDQIFSKERTLSTSLTEKVGIVVSLGFCGVFPWWSCTTSDVKICWCGETQPAFFKGGKDGGIRGVWSKGVCLFMMCVCPDFPWGWN